MTAIVASEINYRYSVVAAAGNTTPGTAAGALGDQVSTTVIADSTLNALFADISAADNLGSVPHYKGFFIVNTNASNAYVNAVLYLSGEVVGGGSVAIGVDPAAASLIGAATAQGATIANETTAPAGVTFTAPTTQGAGIALGSIPAGSCRLVWVRLTPANTVAVNNDGVTFMVYGETGAA